MTKGENPVPMLKEFCENAALTKRGLDKDSGKKNYERADKALKTREQEDALEDETKSETRLLLSRLSALLASRSFIRSVAPPC